MKVFAFIISSFFVIDLFLCTLANIHTDDSGLVTAGEGPDIQNASKSENSTLVADAITSVDGILEPSPIDLIHSKDKIETQAETTMKIETENKNSVDENLGNDTPIVLTESSSLGLEPLGDVTLVVTSQTNDIQSKIAAQLERSIPENLDRNNTTIVDKNSHKTVEDNLEIAKKNVSQKTTEDIPSFSEWAQKRLEEVEKSEQINSSTKSPKTQVVTGKGQNARLRLKNYASPDCGAKVVAANPEATHPGAILYTSEEYKLNPCTSRIWFVVELCEAIQPKRIEIANYELYSSSPKDFTLAVGDRYPSRDWTYIGKFTAKDEKTIQSFDVDTEIFGKYVKVEIKSHYGSEHYCPISLFRVYGTSVFEVLQKEDPANINHPDDDDDDDDEDDVAAVGKDDEKNLFVSAKDAVISIVKKAAEVLGNKVDASDDKQIKQSNRSILINTCSSPIHAVICHNCNETLFGQIYELLSCRNNEIKNLVSIPVIYKSLIESQTCHNFGYELKSRSHHNNNSSSYISQIESFFPMKYIVAMCNEAAILQSNAILNVSQHYFNATKNLTKDDIIYPPVKEVVNKNDVVLELDDETLKQQQENINNDITNTTTSQVSGDTATKIKPTKVLLVDPNLTQTGEVPITTLDHPSSMIHPPADETSRSTHGVESISNGIIVETTTKEINATTSSDNINVVNAAASNAAASDVPSSPMESDTTVMDTIEDHIDHIIADLNSDGQNIAIPTTINNNPTNSPQTPKESIFLRLSNRIKALERNMSLSAQYLEELSKRYKKQVEEIQNLLEKTVGSLRDENAKRNKHLEDRLHDLSITIESLTAERQFLASVLYCLILAIIVSVLFYFFCWKPKRDYKLANEKAPEILRRKSVDDLNIATKQKKKRRPSDQVLKIVRHATISNDEKHKKSKRNRKKTIIPLVRCNSTSSLGILEKDISPDWVEETHNGLEHSIPFALDESDNSILDTNSLPNYFAKSEIPQNGSSHERSKSEVKEIKIDNTPVQYKRSNSESPNHIFMPQQTAIKKEKKGLKKFFKKVF